MPSANGLKYDVAKSIQSAFGELPISITDLTGFPENINNEQKLSVFAAKINNILSSQDTDEKNKQDISVILGEAISEEEINNILQSLTNDANDYDKLFNDPGNYNGLDRECEGVTNGIVREIIADVLTREIIFLKRRLAGNLDARLDNNENLLDINHAKFVYNIDIRNDGTQESLPLIVDTELTEDEKNYLNALDLSHVQLKQKIDAFGEENNTSFSNRRIREEIVNETMSQEVRLGSIMQLVMNLLRDREELQIEIAELNMSSIRTEAVRASLVRISHELTLLKAYDGSIISKFLAKIRNSNNIYLIIFSRLVNETLMLPMLLLQPVINLFRFVLGRAEFLDIFRPLKYLFISLSLDRESNNFLYNLVYFDGLLPRISKTIWIIIVQIGVLSLKSIIDIPVSIYKYGFVFGIKHNFKDLINNIKQKGIFDREGGNLTHIARMVRAGVFALVPLAISYFCVLRTDTNFIMALKDGFDISVVCLPVFFIELDSSFTLLKIGIQGLLTFNSINIIKANTRNIGLVVAGLIMSLGKDIFESLGESLKGYLSYVLPYIRVESNYQGGYEDLLENIVDDVELISTIITTPLLEMGCPTSFALVETQRRNAAVQAEMQPQA
ncbi:hypothetical protein [Rickettsiales endosymbiont of Stachyamoeba lipophora]|uniref:hypothetical protein n=1 Tax=Rickettsiales endosymbiont of Stachyamoeba lipophora TaxID=2486578 RepID=UPI000F65096A|nr:hypothetical protein [Rickettsiales endosymbiont of Stachyamoeba lipophora]AZL15038.1 hypothetical protein EF513_00440 [Rickettsiales endosymbiont of Stachyamoeba lipophora]